MPIRVGGWFAAMVVAAMVQHVAIVGDAIPFTALVIPILILLQARAKTIRCDKSSLILYGVLSLGAGLSFVLNRQNPTVSISSLAYLIYLMFPFVFVMRSDQFGLNESSWNFWQGYRLFMLLASILGFLQIILMDSFVSFRDFIPESWVLNGYNTTNAIEYEGSIYRANGFFFYEPSFYSQFLGIAILAEMKLWRSPFVVGVFLLAMVASFSGTGMMLLMIGLGLQALSNVKVAEIIRAIVPMVALAIFGVYVFPELIFDRLSEFGQENSSAYIRFISPVLYIYDVYSGSISGLFFGIGPGMAASVRDAEVMADFPGLGKVMYEYGVIGLISVVGLYWRFARSNGRIVWLTLALLIFQLLLSSGVLQPATLIMFLVFLQYGGPALREARQVSLVVDPAPFSDQNQNKVS